MNLKRIPQRHTVSPTSANIEASTEFVIPLDRDQYLYGLILTFLGRLTTGGGAAAAINAEAAQSVMRRIVVEMNHEIYGAKNVIDLSGATLFRRAHILGQTPPIVNNGGLAVGNAAYDLEVHYPIIFPLERLRENETIAQLLDAPRCGALNLRFTFSPGAALATTGGATTWTWAGFGGGGNPAIFVTRLVPNGFKGLPKTALVTKTDRNDSLAAAVALGGQIGNEIPLGGSLARVWLKQYVQDPLQAIDIAATMNGPRTQAAAGFTRPQIQLDRKAIREYDQWSTLESDNKHTYQINTWPTGYGLVDFVEDYSLVDILPTNQLAQRKSILSVSGLNNALVNGRLEVGFDQIYPNPQT